MVGVGMRGIPSTKMGGIPPSYRRYGKPEKSYRHYRLYFPDNERSTNVGIGNINYQEGHDLAYLHFQDEPDGVNLLDDTDVTLSSPHWSQSDINTWISARRTNEELSDSVLELPEMRSPYIDIDFKQSRVITRYSVCIQDMVCGWILYGSHDGYKWEMINDIPQDELLAHYDGYCYGTRWYTIDPATGEQPIVDPDEDYKFWGLLIQEHGDVDITYEFTTNRVFIAEIEFRNGSGTDLCTGGTINTWVSPSNRSFTDLFDNSAATNTYIITGKGVSYEFSTKVKPVKIAISSGNLNSETPLKFAVAYSNDGIMWHTINTFDTPIGTWTSGSYTFEEFTL